MTVRGLKPLTAYEFYVEANLESSEMRVKSYLIRCDSGLAGEKTAVRLRCVYVCRLLYAA